MEFYFTVVIIAAAFQQQQGIYKRWVCESHVIASQLVSGFVCGQLTLTSRGKTCTCPGDVLMYECTVVSTNVGFTVLKGKPDDFFKCTSSSSYNGRDLALPHVRFDQGVVEYCNNGAVVGRSLTSENGSYTSQFNITVSSEQLLAGGMIECLHDNGSHVSVVEAANITVTGACMHMNS